MYFRISSTCTNFLEIHRDYAYRDKYKKLFREKKKEKKIFKSAYVFLSKITLTNEINC